MEPLFMNTNPTVIPTFDYQPTTLHTGNQYRRDFLPCFPMPFSSPASMGDDEKLQPALLLSNVPIQMLSAEQLQRRQQGAYLRPFRYIIMGNTPSLLNFMYRYLYQRFSERFRVDEAIIDFNLTRLDEAMTIMAMNRDRQCWTPEQQKNKEELNITFDIAQLAVALEIFLQTDVDLLYMKTCSYRGAQPRLIDRSRMEGIFCRDPPEARYGLLPCQREQCRYCSERRDLTGRFEPTVCFRASHYHQFLNGYQVILNCPATCTTDDIIYALTCPCHQFEYVGQTKMPFWQRLWRHHQHGTRIMHEFLIGTTIINDTLTEPKSTETLAKDRMRLYRHSTLCGTAMQMFLNCNPHYWCCVPMRHVDADRDDRMYVPMLNDPPDYSRHHHDRVSLGGDMVRRDEDIQWFVDHLPLPPYGYRFSRRQRAEQYRFFQSKRDLSSPCAHLDLYNATIVFVCMVPNNCADFVRHFVESLLITHAECKLNTAGQLASAAVVDINNRPLPNPLAHGLWCEQLIHPLPSASFQ